MEPAMHIMRGNGVVLDPKKGMFPFVWHDKGQSQEEKYMPPCGHRVTNFLRAGTPGHDSFYCTHEIL